MFTLKRNERSRWTGIRNVAVNGPIIRSVERMRRPAQAGRNAWEPGRITRAFATYEDQSKAPKRVLALPDLKQAKSAVLDSLSSRSGQRTYDAITECVGWYCSEPRLAFNRTVVLRYRIHLEQQQYAPATINLRLAAVRRVAYEASAASACAWAIG